MDFKSTFQSIIALHQEEFPFDLCERKTKLPVKSERIVTVTGIRRCGKSSLLGLAVNELLQAGVSRERILFVGFDDERLMELRTDNLDELSDIDTVLLVESLPEIKLRTNGISTKKVNIGKFKMADGNKCRLYVNNSTPLFVEIRLDAQDSPSESLVFINRKTVEETKILYEEIIDNVQK